MLEEAVAGQGRRRAHRGRARGAGRGRVGGGARRLPASVDESPSAAGFEGLGVASRWLGEQEAAMRALQRAYGCTVAPATRALRRGWRSSCASASATSTPTWRSASGGWSAPSACSRARSRASSRLAHARPGSPGAPGRSRPRPRAHARGGRPRHRPRQRRDRRRDDGAGARGAGLRVRGRGRGRDAPLDEATAAAVAGELEDLDAISSCCCYLIDACKQVRRRPHETVPGH